MERIDKIPILSHRPRDSHKGIFGTVLVVAGSYGMSGAGALAASAALRSGAGLVRVAVPKSIAATVATINPCYTTIPLDEDPDGVMSRSAVGVVVDAAADCDVAAIGPGLRVKAGPAEILRSLTSRENLKLIIDADGLNNLAAMPYWLDAKKAQIIITPHPGEMKRLWSSLFRIDMPDDRRAQAAKMAAHCGVVTVLKGADTVVTDGARYYINQTGNPGMATGGTGDVLTGVIAALVGQGLGMFEAAILGAHVHGLAGDIGAAQRGELSLIATDLIDHLGDAFKQVISI